MENHITNESALNTLIKSPNVNTNLISDGYHTFGELYEHRIVLFMKLCDYVSCSVINHEVWKSKKHSDGSAWDGWFILGITTDDDKQITYHLPDSYWDECEFAMTLEHAPEFDGHTSADVLERLKSLK